MNASEVQADQTGSGPDPKKTPTPDVWAVVELFGHVKLAGKLSEEEKFGVKMGRLDIPQGDGFITQFFGGASVYRLTPVSEAVARQVNRGTSPAPVSPWDYPKQLPAPVSDPDDDDDPYGSGEEFGYSPNEKPE